MEDGMNKEYGELVGKTMLAVIVLLALIAGIAAAVGMQIEKCAKELDDSKVTQSPTGRKGEVVMDPKEQKLMDARDEADRKWDEADRKKVEAYREWAEADIKRDETFRKLRKYRESKAQQGGKVGE